MVKQHVTIMYERECDAAGQDVAQVKRLAARLQRIAIDCQRLGITIFGGSGSGDLRAQEANRSHGIHDRMLILASIGGPFDGGDGGSSPDENDLMRGE